MGTLLITVLIIMGIVFMARKRKTKDELKRKKYDQSLTAILVAMVIILIANIILSAVGE